MAALRTIALNFGGGGGCMRRDCHHCHHRGAVCSKWFECDRIAIAVVVCSEWFRDRMSNAVVVVSVFFYGRCFVYFVSRCWGGFLT